MFDQLIALDVKLTFLLINLFPHNRFFDLFFALFSHPNRYLIWVVIIIFLIIYEEKKDKLFVIYFLVSLLITGLLVNSVIKNVVKRPRPTFNYLSEIWLGGAGGGVPDSVQRSEPWRGGEPRQDPTKTTSCPKDYSFPSGHAATAFAAASVLTAFDKKRRIFYYLIAVIIAYSRIYLNCHFFFDIVTGGLIGYFISRLTLLSHHPKTTSIHTHGAGKIN